MGTAVGDGAGLRPERNPRRSEAPRRMLPVDGHNDRQTPFSVPATTVVLTSACTACGTVRPLRRRRDLHRGQHGLQDRGHRHAEQVRRRARSTRPARRPRPRRAATPRRSRRASQSMATASSKAVRTASTAPSTRRSDKGDCLVGGRHGDNQDASHVRGRRRQHDREHAPDDHRRGDGSRTSASAKKMGSMGKKAQAITKLLLEGGQAPGSR